MPTSVTILSQIRTKGLDGGFVNGLASYMVSRSVHKNFHYGFFKKQISPFLHDLEIGDNVLICGKCVFNKEDMYVNKIINFFIYFFLP
jgi:hypothetical protein